MSDIRPLVLDVDPNDVSPTPGAIVQQMQDWHTIDESVMPPIVDETRAMVRALVRYLVELGFAPPAELVEDAFMNF